MKSAREAQQSLSVARHAFLTSAPSSLRLCAFAVQFSFFATAVANQKGRTRTKTPCSALFFVLTAGADLRESPSLRNQSTPDRACDFRAPCSWP
jgi:hypothetical protein